MLSRGPPAIAASSSIGSEGSTGALPSPASGVPPSGTLPGRAAKDTPLPASSSLSTPETAAASRASNFARGIVTSSQSPSRAKLCGAA